MMNHNNSQLFKKIDSEKLNNYFKEHKEVKKTEVSVKAFCHRGFISDCIKRGYSRITNFNNVCDTLGVPRDYFDYVEPVPEPVEIIKKEKTECLVDLADIQLSLNKIEILLLEQNKLIRERIEI